ncbi:MT-A70 family methyltransferase [Methylobacterium sp. W2]|uniref:MT-A70 family methyltransferase n=1 Tax=Methylobacterium sp. W2 TaxID=2598107 RepID=UPI001D0C55CF|nr:MT-A70 family methyltransferase [Methylobacterium sp. W2]
MSVFSHLPQRHFRCIVMDSPTKFIGGTKGRPQHYPRMTDHEIAALPIGDLAHPDGCFLLYWHTSPKFYRSPGARTRLTAAEIAQGYGFRYSARAFVWIKTERGDQDSLFAYRNGLFMGQGYTTRKNAEDCLLFKLGKPKRQAANVHEVILAPIREHSRKPSEFYSRVERFCEGPYLEIFARETRPGWHAFGNEASKFDASADPILMAAE